MVGGTKPLKPHSLSDSHRPTSNLNREPEPNSKDYLRTTTQSEPQKSERIGKGAENPDVSRSLFFLPTDYGKQTKKDEEEENKERN